jgi:hypothetical protein
MVTTRTQGPTPTSTWTATIQRLGPLPGRPSPALTLIQVRTWSAGRPTGLAVKVPFCCRWVGLGAEVSGRSSQEGQEAERKCCSIETPPALPQ